MHQAVSQCKVQSALYKVQSAKCTAQSGNHKVQIAKCKVQSAKYKVQCAKCKLQIALDNEELHQQRSNNDTNAGIHVAFFFLLELSICVNYRY